MSVEPAPLDIPKGSGPMIVMGDTAAIIGEPGQVHGVFFALVKHLKAEHVKDGSPLSNQGF